MLPMITELGEIAQAARSSTRRCKHLSRFGHDLPTSLKLGAMLEVPSLLFQLDELMEAVDFVSVGSNDLFQFVMATDRGNTPACRPLRSSVGAVPADVAPDRRGRQARPERR